MINKDEDFRCVMKPLRKKRLKSQEMHINGTLYNLPTKALLITGDGSIYVATSDTPENGKTNFVSLKSIGPAAFTLFKNFSMP